MLSIGRRKPRLTPTQRPPREAHTKATLDRRLAMLLGRHVRDVSAVTAALFHEVGALLAKGHEVQLDGLGTVSVQVHEMPRPYRLPFTLRNGVTGVTIVRRKYYVKFRKSPVLTAAIKARFSRRRRARDG